MNASVIKSLKSAASNVVSKNDSIDPNQPATRTASESAAAKESTKAMDVLARAYTGAGQKTTLERVVQTGVERGEIPNAQLNAFNSLWLETKAHTDAIKQIAAVVKGVSEGLHKFELRLPSLVSAALDSARDAVVTHAAHEALEDTKLSKANAEKIAADLKGAELAALPGVFKQWITLRSDVVERIKAAGLPLIGGSILTYLNNSQSITDAPDARLALLLSLGAAAFWGRGVPTYVSSGIVPAIEYFGSFLGISQHASRVKLTASVVASESGLIASLHPEMRPALFTKGNARITAVLVRITGLDNTPPCLVGNFGTPNRDGSASPVEFDLYSKPVLQSPLRNIAASGPTVQSSALVEFMYRVGDSTDAPVEIATTIVTLPAFSS